MELTLSQNIRAFRKARMMTQEQLAEALGVTVGAVYKWENGRSTPEVETLMELADLFETSVDALLGYRVRTGDRERLVKRMDEARRGRDHTDEAMAEAEGAIRKYPNHFEVIYSAARLYSVASTTQHNRKWAERALALLQHALLLIAQNTDPDVSALSIQRQMAQLWAQLEDYDKAVALLKENNPLHIHHGQIGNWLAISGRHEEALPYLSDGLIDAIVNQQQIADGYLNIFLKSGQYVSAIEVLRWTIDYLRSFQPPDKSCVFNRGEAVYLTVLGEMYLKAGDLPAAKEALRQARDVARRFDADPSYAMSRLRFVSTKDDSMAFDNLGASALDGILSTLAEEKDPQLSALWEEIEHEET